MEVSTNPSCGTKAGWTYSIPQGKYILKKAVEVYHGTYQNIKNKIKPPHLILRPFFDANGTKLGEVATIMWSEGTEVNVNAGGVWLFNPKIHEDKFYAIQEKTNLQGLIEGIEVE